MRTQGGKKDDISYSCSIPRSSQASRETESLQCVLALLPDSAFQTSATVRGLISTFFSFLHPALPTHIRVMPAWVIGSGEGPWLSGAPERFSSSPVSYLPTLEQCWAGHQKTWRPGKPHLGCIQEAILIRYLSHLIWLLPM